MISEPLRKRRIEYWDVVLLKPWAKFDLVPKQVVDDDDRMLWNEIVEAIRTSGLSYRIIETVETIVEEKVDYEP